MKRLISFLALGIAANYVLGGVAACSSEAPPPDIHKAPAVGKRGTLSMDLQAVSESGKIYRLRNATFLVNSFGFFVGDRAPSGSIAFPNAGAAGFGGGPMPSFDGGVVASGGAVFTDGGFAGSFGGFAGAGGFGTGGSVIFPGQTSITLSSEEDPTSPVIERFLAPNSYDIDLLDGWFVEQVDNLLGTSAFVPATLRSSPFQFFNIQSDQETFVRYDFDVDGSRVTFGPPGRLIIGIGVTETNGQGACGNGIVDGMENCDGADLRGATCASATMGARPVGTLFCSPFCTFDTTFCAGGFFDGGTGGTGTGGFGTDGGQSPNGGASGSVGFPGVDAGTAGSGAGGASGKP
jgi:hypothetical protein